MAGQGADILSRIRLPGPTPTEGETKMGPEGRGSDEIVSLLPHKKEEETNPDLSKLDRQLSHGQRPCLRRNSAKAESSIS